MSEQFDRLERGQAKTLTEFFAPIGEQLLSDAERAKRRNQELSAAVQGETETPEQTPYEAKAALVRQLREQGKHAEAAQVASTITDAERKAAFSAMVDRKVDEVKDKPRDWLGRPVDTLAPTDHGTS